MSKPSKKKHPEDIDQDSVAEIQELIARLELPTRISKWTSANVLTWLRDTYDGASVLPTLVENFADAVVKGTFLLQLQEKDLIELGFKAGVQVSQALVNISLLAGYERYAAKEQKQTTESNKKNARLIELQTKYQEYFPDICIDSTPTYVEPALMNRWEAFDIFVFLRRCGQDFSPFLPHLAKNLMSGAELISMLTNDTLKSTFADLDADDVLIRRFKSCVLAHDARLKQVRSQVEEARREELRRDIPEINSSEILQKRTMGGTKMNGFADLNPDNAGMLGEGSFGEIFLVEYKKRNLASKRLKKRTNGTIGSEELARLEREDSDDFLYEACMLQRAAGPGVLQLIGIDFKSRAPQILTEFMKHRNVQYEYSRRASSDSIFNIDHERNKIERTNNIRDPILLQRVRIARDVAQALDRIHSQNIVHLDIAGRNIFLGADKRPKIGDFGFAAQESDLREIHEFRKQKIIEYSGHKNEFEINFKIDLETSCDALDEIKRKGVKLRQRFPVKWWPHWAISYGDFPNPIFDRKIDVYSFGCFLYELAEFQEPHYQKNIQEVIHLKRNGRGNPEFSGDVDARFAAIATMCWESYELQPPMSHIARELVELHNALLSEGADPEMRRLYANLANKKHTEYSNVDQSNYANLPTHGGTTTNYTGPIPSCGVVDPPCGSSSDFPPQAPPNHDPVFAEDRILLQHPKDAGISISDVDFDVVAEVEGIGMSRSKLELALKCARLVRKHEIIALYMQCILLNNYPAQVTLVGNCIDYIAELADDQHSSTDVDNTWEKLCQIIIRVAKSASHLKLEYKTDITSRSLAAIAALLSRKNFLEFSDNNQGLVKSLCSFALESLEEYLNSPSVVQNAALAAKYICNLSSSSLNTLHYGSAIKLLTQALAIHKLDDVVVVNCVECIGNFPMECLLDPDPQKSISELMRPKSSADVSGEEDATVLLWKWSYVFNCMMEIVIRCSKKPKPGQTAKAGRQNMLQAVLCMLFSSCESSSLKIEMVEKFLYGVTGDFVTAILLVVESFPDNFFILEGSIGLMGYVLMSGHERFTSKNMVYIPQLLGTEDSVISLVDLQCPNEARINKFLDFKSKVSKDGIEMILSAMKNYPENETKAPQDFVAVSDANRDMDLKSSVHTTAYGSRYGATYTSSTTDIASAFFTGFMKNINSSVLLELEADNSRLDTSSANLQRSASVVLGVLSYAHPEVQQRLEGTDYREYILQAFVNFNTDVQLVRYSFRALHYTCRRNVKFQIFLAESKIMKYLFDAVTKLSAEWTVIDSVILTLVALLEPPSDYFAEAIADVPISASEVSPIMGLRSINIKSGSVAAVSKPTKKTVDVLKRKSHSFAICRVIVSSRENKPSLFTEIALLVAQHQISPECATLAGSFLKLINALVFWEPALLRFWNNEFIDFTQNPKMYEALGFHVAGSVAKHISRLQETKYTSNNYCSFDGMEVIPSNGPPDLESGNQQFLEINENRSGTLTSQTVAKASVSPQKNVAAFDDKAALLIENALKGVATLLDFVTLSIRFHSDRAAIVGLGLAVLTTIFRGEIKVPLGDPLSYVKGGPLQKLRHESLQYGVLITCIDIIKKRQDHPALIRYCLWILLIFISEDKGRGFRVDTSQTDDKDGNEIASDISIEGGAGGAVDWVVAVLVRYSDNYSIQVLGILFLNWMEHHGKLATRSAESLLQVKEVISTNSQRTTFQSLDADSVDFTLSATDKFIFGDIKSHAAKFIALVDAMLRPKNEDIPVALPVSPLQRGLSSFKDAEATEVDVSAEMLRLPQWDGQVRPVALTLVGHEHVQGTNDLSGIRTFFEVVVVWDRDIEPAVEWSVLFRFSDIRELYMKCQAQVSHLAIPWNCSFEKTDVWRVTDGLKHDPTFISERKTKIQRFLTTCVSIPAVISSPPFRKFLKVAENVPSGVDRVPMKLPYHTHPTPGIPVNSVCYDQIIGLMIVAFGENASLLGGLAKKVRGMVSVYTIPPYSTRSATVELQFTEQFTVGVAAVAFDSKRDIVFVGLTSGPIIFYTLVSDNGFKLVYVDELYCHQSGLLDLIFDPFSDRLISSSTSCALGVYSMATDRQCGQIHQLMKGVATSAIAFDPIEQLVFCLGDNGVLYVYSISCADTKLLTTVQCQASDSTNVAKIRGSIKFAADTRLLFVGCDNTVIVLQFRDAHNIFDISEVCPKIVFDSSFRVSSITLIRGGSFLLVTGESGELAVLDMTSDPALPPPPETMIDSAVKVDETSTTLREIISWSEAIATNNINIMRDWLLRTTGSPCNDIYRSDVIVRIMAAAHKSAVEVAQAMVPPVIYKCRRRTLIAWKLEFFMPTVTRSSRLLRCSQFLDDIGVAVFGGKDGRLQFISMIKLLGSHFNVTETDTLRLREAGLTPKRIREPKIGSTKKGFKSRIKA